MKVRINLEWDVDMNVPEDANVHDAVENLFKEVGRRPFGALIRHMSWTIEEVPPWEQSRPDLRS